VISVGNLVLIAGGAPAVGEVTNVVNVYNAATGVWSATTLSAGRALAAATAVGKYAIVASGDSATDYPTGVPVNATDVFTDPSPSPSLLGSITGDPADGSVTVTVQNTGDAPLPAGSPIACAIRPRAARHVTVLGTTALPRALQPGASEQVTVNVSVPSSLPVGTYHVYAGAGSGHALAIFAADAQPLTIAPPGGGD